eukprot:scaffold79396_cov68-Phaeocystis_antarctica.AAC.2
MVIRIAPHGEVGALPKAIHLDARVQKEDVRIDVHPAFTIDRIEPNEIGEVGGLPEALCVGHTKLFGVHPCVLQLQLALAPVPKVCMLSEVRIAKRCIGAPCRP